MKTIAKIISMLTLMFAAPYNGLCSRLATMGTDPQHSSQINVAGQSLNHNIADSSTTRVHEMKYK